MPFDVHERKFPSAIDGKAVVAVKVYGCCAEIKQ
jgi:hypothetical protein